MPTYILLMTLTPDGQNKMLDDPESVLHAENSVNVSGVHMLGLYGVLGDYDFVSIVEAPDNESVGRFSLQLGVKAGAHIMTLPTIPISRFEGRNRTTAPRGRTGASVGPSDPIT